MQKASGLLNPAGVSSCIPRGRPAGDDDLGAWPFRRGPDWAGEKLGQLSADLDEHLLVVGGPGRTIAGRWPGLRPAAGAGLGPALAAGLDAELLLQCRSFRQGVDFLLGHRLVQLDDFDFPPAAGDAAPRLRGSESVEGTADLDLKFARLPAAGGKGVADVRRPPARPRAKKNANCKGQIAKCKMKDAGGRVQRGDFPSFCNLQFAFFILHRSG